MTKLIDSPRVLALTQGRIKLNSKPTHCVKGPSGWVIVPDLVRA